ncbi:putative DNA helicase [Pseudomonas avellanae BPIC 631]|nr:putative DNA helicase [Pseudomonas avellanae BPIC 631]
MLYLCYNKAVEMAAKNRFPRNVTCKTAHGLAYAVYGSQYKHKQAGNLRLTDIARTINTQDWELAKDIVSTLNAFMASKDLELLEGHFVRFQNHRTLTSVQQQYMSKALNLTRDVWEKMVNIQELGLHDARRVFEALPDEPAGPEPTLRCNPARRRSRREPGHCESGPDPKNHAGDRR